MIRSFVLPAALAALIAAPGAAAAAAADHAVRIDHPRGPVDVRYSSRVDLRHAQVGTVSPGGRASTLRCAWRADVSVLREAHQRSTGHVAARTLPTAGTIHGSRPGWCDGHKAGIAQEVARRSDAVRDHLIAAAERDRAQLLADLDRAHGERQGG